MLCLKYTSQTVSYLFPLYYNDRFYQISNQAN
jgi:hypothetical protein